MGNSPFLKEDKRIFLDTEINIELSAMKHISNSDLIHLYLYGFYEETKRHYLLDLILDVKTEEVIFSYIVKNDQANLVNILPSHSIHKSDFIYSTTNNIVYVNNESDVEYLIRDENKIYKKLFWPQLEETQLIGIDTNNSMEVIDTENKYSFGHSNTNNPNTSVFDKIIIDAYLLDKSPYRNCICMSMMDSNMLLYDYRNKCVVDKIKTNKIVHNISFNEMSQMKMSCSEVNCNISYVYDFRRSDRPLVTFTSFNEKECNKITNNAIIRKQSWLPNHS